MSAFTFYEDPVPRDPDFRVSAWIDKHPQSTDGYTSADTPRDQNESSHQAVSRPLKKSRRALRTASGNRKKMPSKSGSPRRSGRNANKNANQDNTAQQTPKTPQKTVSDIINENEDRTPRAAEQDIFINRPVLRHSKINPSKDENVSDEGDVDPSDSVTNAGKRSSKASSRASSPSKAASYLAMEMADLSIEYRPIENDISIPLEIRPLFREVRKIGYGYQLIPSDMKAEAVREGADEEFDILPRNADTHRQDGCMYGGLTHQATFKRVLEVRKKALTLTREQAHESSWNSEVHSTLLHIATWEISHSTGVSYRQMSHVQLDQEFLPQKDGKPLSDKRIDFGIVIDGEESGLRPSILNFLHMRSPQDFCINPSYHKSMQTNPLAILIETKTADGNTIEGHTQLSTWISAQYQMYRRLAPQAKAYPALPLLFIKGHDWSLYIAEPATSLKHVDIWHELRFGSTHTVRDIYKILAGLKRLVQWVELVYKPWFVHVVLGGEAEYDFTQDKPWGIDQMRRTCTHSVCNSLRLFKVIIGFSMNKKRKSCMQSNLFCNTQSHSAKANDCAFARHAPPPPLRGPGYLPPPPPPPPAPPPLLSSLSGVPQSPPPHYLSAFASGVISKPFSYPMDSYKVPMGKAGVGEGKRTH